ncbi:MAG: response regulator [Candidatus Azobacteroides sp.]|nr:response regulator [Candidatus Azobacteroides sp.]
MNTFEKKHSFLIFLLILLSHIVIFKTYAQQIEHIGVNEGLSGIQSFSVKQDKKGFIWISTRFGIDRFDGKYVKNYPLSILNNGHIPMRLSHVLLDNDSLLWAYTDRGAIYRYATERDEFICHQDLNIYLRNVHFDSENNIWVGTRSYFGMLRGDSLEVIKTEELKGEEIKSFHPKDEKHFLLVSNKEIYEFNIETKKLKKFIRQELLSKENLIIESIFYDREARQIWIGGIDKGLFLYDIGTGELQLIENNHLLYQPVLTITELDENHLLLGTDGAGVCLLDRQTKKIIRKYNHNEEKQYRIKGESVYDIYKDHDGRIWVSTFSDGVYKFDFSERRFHTIKYEENNENALLYNVVCDILYDTDGNVWFATNHGLNRWEKRTNTWQKLLLSKNVLCLFEDSSGQIWVGTYSSGIYVLDKKGTIIRSYIKQHNRENEIGTNFVYTISEDAQKNIWIGGKKGNISRLDPETNTFMQLPVTQANYILPVKDNEILVAAESGIFQIVYEEEEFIQSRYNRNLRSSFINDIHVESDSVVWLGTYGNGLTRYNIKTRETVSFTTAQGLASDFIYSVLKHGNDLWLSSENGLIRFDLTEHTAVNFSKEDGLSSNKFRSLSRTKGADGNLYFGSYDGVTYFNPDEITKAQSSGKIFLQDLYLFNRVVKAGDKNSPLEDALENASLIKLNYKQHSFSIDFTTIDFTSKENRRYMWMLSGLDPQWIGPTTENRANYTNIRSGKYTFILRSIGDNNMVLDERRLEIEVIPPFWNTSWAYAVFICMGLLAVYGTYYYIKQRIRKKQTEEKVKFFINTAHDIRTPLTLISAPIHQLKEEITSSGKTDYLLDLITSNLEKLNSIFSQLLDFQKSYELKDRLIVKEYEVNRFLQDKVKQWQQAAIKKRITLKLNLPASNLFEWFDIEKMDKILDNLLSNAMKYTPEKGEVIIELINHTRYWQITIRDTGIGISRQDRKKLFRRFYRAGNAVNTMEMGSGLGLLLVKRYVSLHKGYIGVSSMENKGSEFYLQFYHGNGHYQPEEMAGQETGSIVEALEKDETEETEKNENRAIKLLIVEDNADLRNFLQISFESVYTVSVAKNGEEAWSLLPKINPDIVLSDLQMPLMDGFELSKRIKNTFETSHIPVILLTVVNDKESIEAGFRLGVDDYIEKPFEVKYLQVKINNIIQNRKILRAKFLGIDKTVIPEQSENDFNKKFITQATAIIEKNIENPEFSIADFSKEMGLSRSLLYTKFRSVTGYTPNDFIKIIRMKKAIEYFREKKYSINEVAFMVGFEDAAYFSNCFKKTYGESPRQFIEKNIS